MGHLFLGLTRAHFYASFKVEFKYVRSLKERFLYLLQRKEAFMAGKLGNAIVVDTNVLIHDPPAIDNFREGGNTLIIPWKVMLELDDLKSKSDIRYDVQEVSRRIEDLQLKECKNIVIDRSGIGFVRKVSGLSLDVPDHQVIATAFFLAKANLKRKKFKKVKLLSRDRGVRILAREISKEKGREILVENYHKDDVDVVSHKSIPEIIVPQNVNIKEGTHFEHKKVKIIRENEGVVCFTEEENAPPFLALRKGSSFKIIDPKINAFGIKPLSLGAGQNRPQTIALTQLLDPDIQLVFLNGGAGTGKTILAVASALQQRRSYLKILITRPMVHLEDEDNMGFLPGDIEAKTLPWWRPINHALSVIGQTREDNNKKITLMLDPSKGEKILFEPLDYIRGMTFHRYFIIVDDAQNLTPHQVKTIITRVGEGTKIVFTGDLGQIDRRRRINQRSSGLNYAINKLQGNPLVGVTFFEETVRSGLARLAEEKL